MLAAPRSVKGGPGPYAGLAAAKLLRATVSVGGRQRIRWRFRASQDFRKSAILMGFESLGQRVRLMFAGAGLSRLAEPLRFLAIFAYGGFCE